MLTWILKNTDLNFFFRGKLELHKTQTGIYKNSNLNSTKVKLPWFLRVGLPLRPNGISDFDILLFVFAFCFVFSFWYFGFGFWVLSSVRFSIWLSILTLYLDYHFGRVFRHTFNRNSCRGCSLKKSRMGTFRDTSLWHIELITSSTKFRPAALNFQFLPFYKEQKRKLRW